MTRFVSSGLAVMLAGGLFVAMQATGQQPPQNFGNVYQPIRTATAFYGQLAQQPNPYANDPEIQKLFAEEQQAAQRSRELAGQLANGGVRAEARTEVEAQLRTALEQIFDRQQKRRTAEITKIEERLNKLKDTMKKREEAKESIIGRRFDVLTGGVDELGWEETGGAGNVGAFQRYIGGADTIRTEENKPSAPADSVLERE